MLKNIRVYVRERTRSDLPPQCIWVLFIQVKVPKSSFPAIGKRARLTATSHYRAFVASRLRICSTYAAWRNHPQTTGWV
ncbi:uncharacterized protein LMH87_007646 [Akanthomyces muscarius]|uniref:Uncharacterized protein n=1 Tax=Akanthomyces muscarius TaxID=2231603 RepID=A0A9W8QLA9_AKAMU|nr:uncharacterized protein LMH87_007646 [Akanthomyces muscarius]KAJ4161616.1 hypothetical protein LMH87_007646 [Akanthomyces muscarius]